MLPRVNESPQEGGIYLTQVTTTCSMVADGGLPAKPGGVRGSVCDGWGLPRLPVSAAMAGRVLLPALWGGQGLAGPQGSFRVRPLGGSGLGDSGDDLSGPPPAADA